MKLLAFSLFAFVAVSAAWSSQSRNSWNNLLSAAKPFEAGYLYRFHYDSQISSGLGLIDSVLGSQQATHRLSAMVNVHFETDRSAFLKLEDIRIASLNGELLEVRNIQSMKLFDEEKIESKKLEQLESPCKFELVDGMIERINFDSKDDTWSKNIKRSIMNMIQINLKQRQSLESSEYSQKSQEMTSNSRSFDVQEVTLEGKCKVSYTVNKLITEEDREVMNVTKTIDFKNCSELPTIYYGPRIEKPTYASKMEDLEERQLDRLTTIRYQIRGTEDKYAIGNVELLSQYVYKTVGADSMQTVVSARLLIKSATRNSDKLSSSHLESKDETLLYSTQWDRLEKRFYQYGDEEFSRETSPFAHVEQKVKMIHSMIRKIAESTEDKTNGIETEVTLKLPQVVELLRMCTITELEDLFSKVESNNREVELVTDACAIAGTYNTIKFLAERIQKSVITPTRAILTFRQFSSLPAISDKQVDVVLRLCQHNVMEKSSALRQACWLTLGSMISEVCKGTIRDEKICPRHKQDKYEEALWTQYKEAENLYGKTLALKVIGNAALSNTIHKLEKVIVDRREPTAVRVQAIDALRRLRNAMPIKIQRLLLPVFTNSMEVPEIRMHAFSMMMHCTPDKTTLDSIAYTLHRERSTHVRSFALSCFKAYSSSPIPEEREVAQHLRSILMMAKVDLDGACRYHRVPIYSADKKEGLFFNWASIFSTSDSLPKHMSLSLDTLLNGLLEKDSVSISLTQHNIEGIYHQFMETIFGRKDNIRGRRSSRNGEEELDSIFNNLKIKARETLEKNPFGLITLRIRDVDQVVVPLAEEHMPACIKAVINGERPSLRTFDSSIFEGKPFRFASALSLHERTLKIATSSGMPLRLSHTIPMLASVDGKVKLNLASESQKVTVQLQPRVSAVHSRKMELWCPIMSTGVESLRSLELNLPINMDVVYNSEMKEQIMVTLYVPEEKARLVGLHSLPFTYVRQYDAESFHGQTHVKTIRNIMMEPRMMELTPSRNSFTVGGHFHKPTEMTFHSICNMLWSTENHVQVQFDRLSSCAEKVVLTIGGKTFERAQSSSVKPRFEQFYKDEEEFKPVYDDDVEDWEDRDSVKERRSRLDDYLNKEYQPRSVYRHMIKTSLKTVGGDEEHRASLQIDAHCDSQMAYCKINSEVRRTPIFDDESQEWELKAESQILMPEYVSEISELNEKSRRHNKLATTLHVEWGAQKVQKVTLKLQGERAVPQKWIQRSSGDEWRQVLATAFLNKYDLVADYKLSPSNRAQIERYFDYLRLWNYWSVDASEGLEGVKNEISATLILDPRTRQHFNISVKTPTERVRLTNIQLPMTLKPFTLVRSQQQRLEIHSMEDALSQYADSGRAECRVDGRRVKTFDSVTYKAPVGKCYSVVAKDCSKKSFVVLMKTVDESTDAKKLKIITSKRVIEAELIRDKVVVTVDGEKVEDVEKLREYNIEHSEDLIRCNLPEGVTVRFDGKQVIVKMSHYYKNSQCGLCGHFDGEENDEFRKSDNTLTDDVKDFHRSYSMLDEGCDNIYEKSNLFGMESSPRSSPRRHRDDDEADYEDDQDIQDYDMFDRKQVSTNDDDEEPTEEPLAKTITKEYNHKICFSLRPVHECPRGSHATRTDNIKIQFGCLNRSSTEARRLLRESRSRDISSRVNELNPSFTDTVRTARVCA